MVPPNEERDLTAAWRALSGLKNTEEGWQAIPVITRLNCRLLAARHFPGNEEAILIGLRAPKYLSDQQLPEGSGFLVLLADLGSDMDECKWLALLRQPNGSLEIFTMMAADIISTLEISTAVDDDSLLRIFLARIRAWQSFMQRVGDGLLSLEDEIGLHGELIFLNALLKAGTLALEVIEAWQGPKNGLHDFRFGAGAFEVKTAVSRDFLVSISSLEQMDNSQVSPLFLVGIRLQKDMSGKTLKDRIDKIIELLGPSSSLAVLFENLLIHAGYSPSMWMRYTRKFTHKEMIIFQVDEIFPKLTRENVSKEITKVQYQIDLDKINSPSVSLNDVLHSLGRL